MPGSSQVELSVSEGVETYGNRVGGNVTGTEMTCSSAVATWATEWEIDGLFWLNHQPIIHG